MSELKEHKFCESDEFFREYHGPLSNETHLYYLKSEADKVIADLEESHKMEIEQLLMEIVELKEKRDTAEKLLNKALYCVSNGKNHMISLARKNNHANYKRCLAMAEWCEMCHRELLTRACLPTKQNWNRHDEWRYFVNFWHRYEYRFRKLAEKFKEAK